MDPAMPPALPSGKSLDNPIAAMATEPELVSPAPDPTAQAGHGNVTGGIYETQPGALAVKCPACPHPGINLPEDWNKVDESMKFLYYLIIAMDANFRLKDRARSSTNADPGLHTGLAYFVPEKPYAEYILRNASQTDVGFEKDSLSMHMLTGHQPTRLALVQALGHWRMLNLSIRVGCERLVLAYVFVHAMNLFDLKELETFKRVKGICV
ncbi:uncharacterized protein F5891DRAFT_1187268 [Suillus fuscotomentosus]|uniref:Uncharacterized protein n=1 Tax=Suillus fuscotomentosus TaxID=1912939 RepID=A0AAD4E8Q8_9AGAM|nr:uncharacterized protein F5891DRAFT_1187268 [Suillus fuscotomentosus]KAG1901793.1 hypothetical protein F5891DRAFT_1187268 [Suillus fuscotomentosus]